MSYARHYEKVVEAAASPDELFEYLDDPRRLGGHMEKPSAMMMGGSMAYDFDAAQGRAVDSIIRIKGGFLGLELSLEEVVTAREPPRSKTWETRGPVKLLIMESYRMGFKIGAAPDGASTLRVFIDYSLPRNFVARAIGMLLAPAYARWCVDRMAGDANRRFSTSPLTAAPA
jgi:hypothetical protein